MFWTNSSTRLDHIFTNKIEHFEPLRSSLRVLGNAVKAYTRVLSSSTTTKQHFCPVIWNTRGKIIFSTITPSLVLKRFCSRSSLDLYSPFKYYYVRSLLYFSISAAKLDYMVSLVLVQVLTLLLPFSPLNAIHFSWHPEHPVVTSKFHSHSIPCMQMVYWIDKSA